MMLLFTGECVLVEVLYCQVRLLQEKVSRLHGVRSNEKELKLGHLQTTAEPFSCPKGGASRFCDY